MPPLEIAVSIGRGWFYVPHCFNVFTTGKHIDLILIPRYVNIAIPLKYYTLSESNTIMRCA